MQFPILSRIIISIVALVGIFAVLPAMAQDIDHPPGLKRAQFDLLLLRPGLTREMHVNALTKLVRKYDRNGDGLTLREIEASKKKRRWRLVRSFLSLDPNNDDRLTNKELEGLVDDAFRRHDKNTNDVMEHEEVKLLLSLRMAVIDRSLRTCKLPMPSRDEHVVVFGTYRGKSISTTSVAGPNMLTTSRPIRIESGDNPLYVVLTAANSVIWKFEGATERVSRAVVITRGIPRGQSAGVVGLRADRVQFMKPGSCPTYSARVLSPDYLRGLGEKSANKKIEESRRKAAADRAKMELLVDRKIENFAYSKTHDLVSLPSGKTTKLPMRLRAKPDGIDARIWQLHEKRFPGGVDEIDPNKVVSPNEVVKYTVLPQYAGLAQLLRASAIEPIGEREYRILKPFAHVPAGLAHGHRVTFRLGRSVPKPGGFLGNSCIISEESGLPLKEASKCPKKKR